MLFFFLSFLLFFNLSVHLAHFPFADHSVLVHSSAWLHDTAPCYPMTYSPVSTDASIQVVSSCPFTPGYIVLNESWAKWSIFERAIPRKSIPGSHPNLKATVWRGMVAQACNSNYLGDGNQEDGS
jgi:hypothetical protein